VNVDVNGSIVAPAAFVPPDAEMVYVVFAFSGAVGVKLAVFVVVLYADEPATALPAGSVTPPVSPVVTDSLNVTEMLEVTATFVAPEAGVTDVTVGRAAVVKVHVTGAIITLLLDDLAPETVTV
jgi:hypothetical protein